MIRSVANRIFQPCEVVRVLGELRVDLEATKSDGYTPMHTASKIGAAAVRT